MSKLIKLGKPGCTPCTQLDNHLNDLGVEFESVNILENIDVAVKYGVMSTPVLILEDDNGNELDRVMGFNPSNKEPVNELVSQL